MRKLILIFILTITSCGVKSDFINMSNSMMKREPMYKSDEKVYASNKKAKYYLNRERKIRNNIYEDGQISFFTAEEPFYILDGYDIETGISYYTMWNSKGSINFELNKMNYKICKEQYYSEDLRQLIEEWKIDIIKNNVKEKGNIFGALQLTARVILFNDSKSIKEMKLFGFSEYDEFEEKM